MRIAVDACILELPCPTGVERAAGELLRRLPDALAPGDELLVLSRGPLPDLPPRARGLALGGPEAPLLFRETRLAPALSSEGADVLWSPVTALPLRTAVPCVATFHEAPWLVRPGLEGRFRETAHRIRLRIAAETAARIVCPSRASKGQLDALHPEASERVRVVPHGVPRYFTEPGRPESDEARRRELGAEPPYLLHVGGTRPRKNVPLLLRAYARYRLRGGRAGLVLAGPGETPPRLPRGATHTGYVEDAALRALYDGARALVIASESEGFGLPALEAMARGVPVVASAAGALPEVVGDAGLLVPPGDEAGLAEALSSLDDRPALHARLVAAGRRRAALARFEDAAALLRSVLAEAADAA